MAGQIDVQESDISHQFYQTTGQVSLNKVASDNLISIQTLDTVSLSNVIGAQQLTAQTNGAIRGQNISMFNQTCFMQLANSAEIKIMNLFRGSMSATSNNGAISVTLPVSESIVCKILFTLNP